jgi:imidazolonepropionase-like amidohydrolase
MASGGAMTPGTDVGACQFADEELRFAVDESHRAGLAITAHAHALIAVRQAIDAGVDGIEHCTCVGPNGLEMPDDVLQLLAERRIAVCPTLGNVPGATPPPRVQEFLVRYNMTESDRINAFARAHAAGVLIISGDDAGIGPGKRHGVGPEPVIQLQQGGVPTPDALATATSIAADVCGVGATKGRLRAGHDADVLLVYGDATADTTALRSVAAVVVAGAIVIDNADGRAVAP